MTPQSPAATAPLAGEPLGLQRIPALPEPPGLCRRFSPGGERAVEVARPRDSKGKCIRIPTSCAITSPVQSRHIAAGEDGHHFGRARQSARPPSVRRTIAQQPHRNATGGAAALRTFLAHIGARPITRKFRRQTEADTFRPPPKAFFLSGSLRDAFFWQDKRKRPSGKVYIIE